MTPSANGKTALAAFDINLLKPPELVNIHVDTAYGRSLDIPFAPLTYHRYNELGALVPQPAVPRTGIDPNSGKPIANPSDPEYLLAQNEAANLRDFLRIAEGMTKARDYLRDVKGEPDVGVDLPGEDLMEKAEWLRDNIDAAVSGILIEAMWKLCRKGATQIEDRAASFHAVSTGGAAGLQPTE